MTITHPEILATGDPAPVPANPLILNDAYFEMNGVNLRCLVQHLEVSPEVKQVTVTSFCAETDYPGVVKWHLRVTFYQSFDIGAVYDTLNAAYMNYANNGAPVEFKTRPYSSRVAAANNPIISGFAIPQPFDIMNGDAGAASQIQIDWNLTAPPNVDQGAVPATGASAGAPGFFTPSGAITPANLAALSGIAAAPATAWATGQYVITADFLAAHWDGAAWAIGKAPVMDGGSELPFLSGNGSGTPDASVTLAEMVHNADPNVPLPTEIGVTLSFVKRLPTQRLLDSLTRLDPTPFGELQDQRPSQVIAFRWLVREFPGRDHGSLWMHAYDVEIEIADSDPTLALGQMPSLPSAPTTE